MSDSNFQQKKCTAESQIAEAIRLVRKVMGHGFGEVVIKVQDGRIVMLEERLMHRPSKNTNSWAKS